MLLRFQLVSVQSGDMDLPAYIDASEITSWSVWRVGDDVPPGMHRKLRGKVLTTLQQKNGAINWTEESFHSVSTRILTMRALILEAKTAEISKALHECSETERAEAAASKKSSLAVV